MPGRLRKLIFILSLFISPQVLAQLNANFTLANSKSSDCPGTNWCFNNTSTGNPTSFKWEISSGSGYSQFSVLQNPCKVLDAPGVYSIRLTVYNGSSNHTTTKTSFITVYDTPKVDFTVPAQVGCAPMAVNFTNTTVTGGGSGTYTWFFGDGNQSGLANPTHTYANGGTCYSVTLQCVNSYGCQKSRTKVNFICPRSRPVAGMSTNKNVLCKLPDSVIFTAGPTGTGPFTYSWDFGDPGSGNNTSTLQSPTHTYTGTPPKSFTVKLVVTDSFGCKDSVVASSYINAPVHAGNFSGPSQICQGNTAIFKNTSTPGYFSVGSFWNFGTPTAMPPTYVDSVAAVTYTAPGTFNVKLINNYGGCIDTVTKPIIVHPKPDVTFTMQPDSPCPAPVTISFYPNATYTTYYWDFGDSGSTSNTSTLANASHLYTKNGSYYITLVVSTSAGCKDTFGKPLIIYYLEDSSKATKMEGCKPLTTTFSAYALNAKIYVAPTVHTYPYPVVGWHWDFGDGVGSSTLPNPTYTYNDTGVFRVISTLTTKNGCIAKDTIYIKVGIKPNASFTGPSRICYRDMACFTSTSIQPPTINRYNWIWSVKKASWQMENPGFDTGMNLNVNCHHFSVPKTDTVRLVTYHNGCPSDTAFHKILIDSPKAIATVRYKCHKDSLKYVQFADSSIGADSRIWYFGDGPTSTSTAKHPLHLYPAYGSYSCTLVVHNVAANCYDTMIGPITLFNPVAKVTASDTAICKDDTVWFSSSLTGANIVDQYWYINGSFIVSPYNMGATAFYPFNLPGTSKVWTDIKDEHSCINSDTAKIFVSRPLPAFYGFPLSGCVPFNVTFTDTSKTTPGATIVSRKWEFGNGSLTTTSTTVVRQYTLTGSYDVQLKITDNIGCKDSMYLSGYVQAHKPTALFTTKTFGCVGEMIGFTNLSANADSTFWDYGDGATSNGYKEIGLSMQHSYKNTGSYTVKIISKDGFGCFDTLIKPAAITIIKPAAAFTMDTAVSACTPLKVKFTNQIPPPSGGYSYWEFGNGNSSFLLHPTEAYMFPGIYTVTLVISDAYGCKDTAIDYVDVLGHAGSFSLSDTLGCIPLTVTYAPNVKNVTSMVWDFGDGTTINSTNLNPVSHTYTTAGPHVPKLVITTGPGCIATSVGDTVKVDEAYADFAWGPACINSEVYFYDSSSGYYSGVNNWLWKFDNGQVSGLENPSHYYGPAGIYPVKLRVININGCIDSVTKDVTINPLPDIQAGGDTTICLKDSAILMPSGGVSYVWSPAMYLSCTNCPNPKAGPPVKTWYFVTGTDANGCKNTDTVVVSIKTKVTAIAAKGGEICDKDTFQLSVTGARSYEWTPAEPLDKKDVANPVARPYGTTTFRVVSFEGSCIPDTDFVNVVVHPLPTVTAKGATKVIAGTEAQLIASGNLIERFEWTGTGLDCYSCPDPIAKPYMTTIYTVTVYTDFGCKASDDVVVEVQCDNSQLYIPNTFTPNGDGENDVFYLRGAGLSSVRSLRVYNRWGEVMFERSGFALNDKGSGWDGTYKGKELPPDVYVYVVEALCSDQQPLLWKGDISLVR
jgi:gliding motility-associated-like protein